MAADGAAKAKSLSRDAMDKSKVLAAKGKVMAKQGLDGAKSKANQASVHMKNASASASKAASCMRECQSKCTAQAAGRRTRRRRGGGERSDGIMTKKEFIKAGMYDEQNMARHPSTTKDMEIDWANYIREQDHERKKKRAATHASAYPSMEGGRKKKTRIVRKTRVSKHRGKSRKHRGKSRKRSGKSRKRSGKSRKRRR